MELANIIVIPSKGVCYLKKVELFEVKRQIGREKFNEVKLLRLRGLLKLGK